MFDKWINSSPANSFTLCHLNIAYLFYLFHLRTTHLTLKYLPINICTRSVHLKKIRKTNSKYLYIKDQRFFKHWWFPGKQKFPPSLAPSCALWWKVIKSANASRKWMWVFYTHTQYKGAQVCAHTKPDRWNFCFPSLHVSLLSACVWNCKMLCHLGSSSPTRL